jgi:hypothetical protein
VAPLLFVGARANGTCLPFILMHMSAVLIDGACLPFILMHMPAVLIDGACLPFILMARVCRS